MAKKVICIHPRIHDGDFCLECGATATDTHHTLFGNKDRDNAEKFGLTIRLCRNCHSRLHDKDEAMAEKYRRLGQLCFEYEYGHEEYMRLFYKNHI